MFLYKALYFFKRIDYQVSMWLDKAVINWRLRKHQRRQIDKAAIKTILLLRNDGIGDMVITTALIRVLAQHGYQVSVMSQKSALEIIQNNPHVTHTFVWNDNYSSGEMRQIEQQVREQHFDLIIDMRYPVYFKHSPHRIMLPYYLGGKYTLGWNKSALKCYDASINHYTRRGHYITLVQKFLAFLNIHNADLSYEFFIDPASEAAAGSFIDALRTDHGKVIVLNPFSGHPRRDMTNEQIRQSIELLLSKYPQAHFIAIGVKTRVEKLIDTLKIERLVYYNSKSILDVVPLIQRADLVISPDTSIIHVVAAFQKPLVGLYASGRRTPRSLSDAKTHIKEKYHEQVDEARARFFDGPNVRAGTRPKGKLLLVENSFGPNNKNAIQLKNYTHRLSEIPAEAIFEACDQLLSRTCPA